MVGAGVTILGIFVADTAYLAHRMPDVGETIKGSGFAVGPGGKGSNQAVAAAKAGAEVSFISRSAAIHSAILRRKPLPMPGLSRCW